MYTVDIINIYCLGYNGVEIQRKLGELGIEYSYDSIVKNIRGNNRLTIDTEKYYTKLVGDLVDKGMEYREIRSQIKYRGIGITGDKLRDYIGYHYTDKIEVEIKGKLEELFKCTGDKEVVSRVGRRYNITT